MTKHTKKPTGQPVDRKSAAAGDKEKPGFTIVGSPVVPLTPVSPAAAAPKPDAKPEAPPVNLPKPPEKAANKRITPGAEVKEWRIARSLRASQPGYFLQGGHFQKTSRGNSFIVGQEIHFTDLKKANEALAAKRPPKAVSPTPPAPPPPPKTAATPTLVTR